MEIKYKNIIMCSFAALTLSVTSIAVVHNAYQAQATNVPAASQSVMTIEAFKKDFIKNDGAEKSKWKAEGVAENANITAATSTLSKFAGKDGVSEVSMTSILDLAPKATKMAVLNDISDVLLQKAGLTFEHLNAGIKNSVAVHKQTRKLIDIYYTRDDVSKKDTFKDFSKEAVAKIEAEYKALSELSNDELTFIGGKEVLKTDLMKKVKDSDQKEVIYQKSFDYFKAAKKKTSVGVLNAIEKAADEVFNPKEVLVTEGDAKEVVKVAEIPGSTETIPRKLVISKVKPAESKMVEAKHAQADKLLEVFEIKVKDNADKEVNNFDGKKVKLSLVVSDETVKALTDKAQEVKLFHIHGNKNEKTEVQYTFDAESKTINFEVDHFSQFALVRGKKINAKAPNSGYQANQTAPVVLSALGLLVVAVAVVRLRK